LKLSQLIYVIIVINSIPASVTSAPFDVNLMIKGAKPGTNYLRAQIYKEGTTNYFGETFNGKDWYSGNDGKNYFPVQINSSSTSTTIQVKAENTEAGSYKLKIKRYTASGSLASNDDEKEADIQIAKNKEEPSSVPVATSTPIEEAKIEITPLPVATFKLIATIIPEVKAISTYKPVLKKDDQNHFNLFSALIFGLGLFSISIPILMFVKKRIDKV
jgi:hypothetical protein